MQISCDPQIPNSLPYGGDTFDLACVKYVNYAGLKNLTYPTYDGKTQKLDIAIPENGGLPVPLVVYFHPGGFFKGSKGEEWKRTRIKKFVCALLDAKIAFANVNYRKLRLPSNLEKAGIKKPLYDCVAALQWLLYNATCLSVDLENIALKGGSAGASSALWIGFSPDMKTGSSDHLGQSTRVKAVVALQPQASLDMRNWTTKVFDSLGSPSDLVGVMDLLGEDKFRAYYKVDLSVPLDGVLQDKSLQIGNAVADYIASNDNYTNTGQINLNTLKLFNKKDPPVWIENTDNPAGIPTDPTELVHHPSHVHAFLNKLQLFPAADYPEYFVHTDNPLVDEYGDTTYSINQMVDFLKARFGI